MDSSGAGLVGPGVELGVGGYVKRGLEPRMRLFKILRAALSFLYSSCPCY